MKKFLILLISVILFLPASTFAQLGEQFQTGDGRFGNVSELRYEGYIIEFKEKPMIEYVKEPYQKLEILEREAEKLEREIAGVAWYDIFGHIVNISKTFELSNKRNEINKVRTDISNILREKGNKISTLHNRIKTDLDIIKETTPKESGSVMGEFKNVFSGISLNISDETAERLKTLDYVKDVHPNYMVNITLTGSIPLINADDVWELNDSEGRKITGQGMTIAIIDTGIDYRHPDLGECFGSPNASWCDIDGYCSSLKFDLKMGENKTFTYNGENHTIKLFSILYRYIAAIVVKSGSSEAEIMYIKEDRTYLFGAMPIHLDDLYYDNNASLRRITLIIGENAKNCPDDCDESGRGGCKIIGGYDFTLNGDDPMDDHGHGTHCAGIAAGNGKIKGVAPDAKLYAYKVLSAMGWGWEDNIIEAIERSVDPNQDGDFSDHADIISMSFGVEGYWPDDPMSQAVDNAVNFGVIAVAAAGNDGPGHYTIASPGISRKAITVGATCKPNDIGKIEYCDNEIASFSSRGPTYLKYVSKPDIVAPGVNIYSTVPVGTYADCELCDPSGYKSLSGTSMATPHVAGAAALLKQAHPEWSPDEIKYALRNTGVDSGYEVVTQGFGRIDAFEAVSLQTPPLIAYLETSGLFNNREEIVINGDIPLDDERFKKHSVEYGSGFEPDSWTPIKHEKAKSRILARFNPNSLEQGLYQIRLIVHDRFDQVSEDRSFIKTIAGQQKGWPKVIGMAPLDLWFTAISPSIVIKDLDGDGENELIAASKNNNKMFVFHHDGTVVNGWPKETLYNIYSTPAIDDVNKDGEMEIVVMDEKGGLYIWDKDGNEILKLERHIKGFVTLAGLVLGDLDNDGDLEIILNREVDISNATSLPTHAFHHDGRKVEGWPTGPNKLGNTIPAAGDLNNDGNLEVVASYQLAWNKTVLYVFNPDGTNANGWPKIISGISSRQSSSAPALGDIDNDGDLEIVTSVVIYIRGEPYYKIYAFHHDGTIVNGWPKRISDPSSSNCYTPVLGDIDGDGDIEIVLFFDSWNGTLYAFHHNGEKVNGWPKYIFMGHSPYYPDSQPTIADLDGDGDAEILVSDGRTKLYAFHHDGEKVNGWPKSVAVAPDYIDSQPTVSDLDCDGDVEVSVFTEAGIVYVWDLPGDYNPEKMEWPKYRRDGRNTGLYPPKTLEEVCKKEGEGFNLLEAPRAECCSGLTAIAISSGEPPYCDLPSCPCYICTYCGDGICDSGENPCNCPKDCPFETNETEAEIIAGQGEGGNSLIRVFDKDGNSITGFRAFGEDNSQGEVHLAVGDVNGDGKNEIIAGQGEGGNSLIRVFDKDGNSITGFRAFGEGNAQGEVHLASGDINGDGKDEIITGHGAGGSSWVRIFSYNGSLLSQFRAFGPANSGGEVHLAVGNFDSDSDLEIAVSTGSNGLNLVKIFESNGTLIRRFAAFGPENPSGEIHIASGDSDGDGRNEIIAGHGAGGSSWVRIFSYNGSLLSQFRAFGPANSGGEVHLAAGDINGDGKDEIITGHGEGGSSWVRIFDFSKNPITSFKAFGEANTQGEVNLASWDLHFTV